MRCKVFLKKTVVYTAPPLLPPFLKKQTFFYSFVGGAIAVNATEASENITISFVRNTISKNEARFGGGLAAVLLQKSAYASDVSLSFSGDVFKSNNANGGDGGGAFIVMPIDQPFVSSDLDPEVVVVRGWNYSNNVNRFDDVTFRGNAAACSRCTGGGLYVSSGLLILANKCKFEENDAGFWGGGLSLSGSSTMAIINESSFVHNTAPAGGTAIYSLAGGKFSLSSPSFEVGSENMTSTFLDIPQGPDSLSLMSPNVLCPHGHMFVNNTIGPYTEEIDPWGFVNVSTWLVACRACPSNQYSLQAAHIIDGQLANNFSCLECPDYAECSQGGATVFALPGYWCGSFGPEEDEIGCLVCPLGYCQSETLLPWDEACTGNRTGTLCGECSEGYSEAWGTSACVAEGECGFSRNSWCWLILLALAFGLIYVVLLVWLPVGDHPLWKSLLYFMQIAALVVTANGQALVGSDDTASGVLNGVLTFFVLDPDVLGIHVGVCPWSGLTAVQKMASGYLLPVTLFVELALIGGGHLLWSLWWFRWRKRRRNERGSMSRRLSENGEEEEEVKDLHLQDMRVVVSTRPTLLTREKSVVGQEEEDYSDDDISATPTSEDRSSLRRALLARYGAGTIALTLVTYESFTSITMDLLHCVRSVGVDDNSLVLFRAGTEACFSWWQIVLLILLGTLLVPFPISLVLLRWLIRSRTWLQHSTLGKAILMVLERPYARHYKWWESWGMFRRLALITLATFVLDPLGRAIGLFGGCLFALLMHLGARPYQDNRHNRVETIFLSDLVLIAALDIPQATTQHLGSSLDNITLSMFIYTQSVLLLLPLAYCFLVVSLMLGTSLIGALISRCRKNRANVSSDAAAYNLYTEDDDRGTTSSTSSALVAVLRWICAQVFLLEWNDHLHFNKREDVFGPHMTREKIGIRLLPFSHCRFQVFLSTLTGGEKPLHVEQNGYISNEVFVEQRQ